MILYFADRNLQILGSAHTNLKNGYKIIEDKKVEDVDVGIPTFTAKIFYEDDETRLILRNTIKAGNYLLRHESDDRKTQFVITGSTDFYTIIETEDDPGSQTIYIYAEGGGLDLLNDLTVDLGSSESRNARYYFDVNLEGTSFHIRNDKTDPSNQKALIWDANNKETIIARLQSISKTFNIEFQIGFDIDRFTVIDKWIDIAPAIGDETHELLHSNINVNKVVVKESIANVATALYPTGNENITLYGFDPSLYPEVEEKLEAENMYLATISDGTYIISDNSYRQWRREGRQIYRSFSTNAIDQKTLCLEAIEELKKRSQPEINYEVDIVELPANSKIGDRVDVVDRHGEIYVSARILKLESSVVTGKKVATLGEYKIKGSGISDTVRELATRFKEIANNRTLYTWAIFAVDRYGTGATMYYDENKKYVGYLENQKEELVSDEQLTSEKIEETVFQFLDADIDIDVLHDLINTNHEEVFGNETYSYTEYKQCTVNDAYNPEETYYNSSHVVYDPQPTREEYEADPESYFVAITHTVYKDDEEENVYYYLSNYGLRVEIEESQLDRNPDGSIITSKSIALSLENLMGLASSSADSIKTIGEEIENRPTKTEVDDLINSAGQNYASKKLEGTVNEHTSLIENINSRMFYENGTLYFGLESFPVRLALNENQAAFVDINKSILSYFAANAMGVPKEETNEMIYGVYEHGVQVASNFRKQWKVNLQYDLDLESYDLVFEYVG